MKIVWPHIVDVTMKNLVENPAKISNHLSICTKIRVFEFQEPKERQNGEEPRTKLAHRAETRCLCIFKAADPEFEELEAETL